MKTIAALGLCVASLFHGMHAQAQSRGPGWDMGIDLIYQLSKDVHFQGGSKIALDDDLGVALTFGYRFDERFELGLALDWQSIDYRATLQSGLAPGLSADVAGDLEAFTPRLWANYNFLPGPLTPFVNAGVGWSWVDTNIPNSPVQVGCWWDPWWGLICTPYQSTKTVDDLVYQAGVGGRWDLPNGFTLRLAYEKHWFDYSKATSTPDFDQIKLGFEYRY